MNVRSCFNNGRPRSLNVFVVGLWALVSWILLLILPMR